MYLLNMFINYAHAVGYIPHNPEPRMLPTFSQLQTIENILLYALVLFLALPLFKNPHARNYAKFRRSILGISFAIGFLFLSVHAYGVFANAVV